ncbi:transcriptional enhancer factor TEF-1-like isoform X3 [Rhincodon typus]|uniref:transcriptional enhancer factor TEF-1-like isoform X3 n=1 Tax=Rhincodon typus TaxID=259920 RepID=UPI00202DBFC1|nr:transcriptional enhancer factor TEF-1-like isoform X3 [Rhincodon typus]
MMPLIPEIFPEPVTSPASKILHLQKISLERKLLTAPKSGWLEPFTSELPLHLVKEEEAKHVAEQSLFKNKGLWKPDQHPRFVTPQIPLICRNELIARYIKLRTGKTRTRKQVSSHIQVLARRKSREIHSKLKTPEFFQFWSGAVTSGEASSSQDVKPFIQQPFAVQPSVNHAPLLGYDNTSVGLLPASCHAAWQGRCIGTTKIRLVEFSAFMEQQRDQDTYNKHLFVHIGQSSPSYNEALLESVDIRQIYDKFPEKKGGLKELFEKGTPNTFFLVKFWADLSIHIQDEAGMFYGVTSQYESAENMTITCSSKVCSFGKQVVEKVETEYARFENGRFLYRIRRSPMCEYLINFIHKLKQLPEKYMMNSVLENFTILQVVTNRDTQELLLCVAYVFEVSTSEHGAQHHIYKLVKD